MNGKCLVSGIVVGFLLLGARCGDEGVGATPTQQVYEVVMNERVQTEWKIEGGTFFWRT